MAFDIVTPPTEDALSLTEIKEFLRLDSSDTSEDTTLGVFRSAALSMSEEYTRRLFCTTVIDEYFDSAPAFDGVTDRAMIYLSRGPVASVTSVKYIDELGAEITVSTSDYTVDTISEPARIMATDGWFDAKTTINAVIIRYTVGTAASAVGAPLKQAMLLMISDMYEKRENSVHRMPTASEYLMNPFRLFRF